MTAHEYAETLNVAIGRLKTMRNLLSTCDLLGSHAADCVAEIRRVSSELEVTACVMANAQRQAADAHRAKLGEAE